MNKMLGLTINSLSCLSAEIDDWEDEKLSEIMMELNSNLSKLGKQINEFLGSDDPKMSKPSILNNE